jgi:hypothetical protein
MRHTQEQGPAAHALSRTALIVAQAQFFDLIKIAFDLEAARIGVDHLSGVERQIGTEQVPRREVQPECIKNSGMQVYLK